MKKSFPFIVLICLPLLMSLRFSKADELNSAEELMLGSWKIDEIIKGEETKKGRKVLTFSEDHTFISVKDNGSTMNGEWRINEADMQLLMDSNTDDNQEIYDITKLNSKKMELVNQDMTVKLSRVK